MAPRLLAKGLGRDLRAKVLQGKHCPDKVMKRMLQCIGSCFPSNGWLKMTNLRSSSKCDLCQAEHESIYHIQQDCPELADALTKAHNDIWAEVWEVIKVTASKSRWSTYYETPIKDTGLKYSQALPAATIANRRPDGIIMKQLDESSKRHVILFNFTRCHCHDLVSLMEASNQKNAGYQELTEHLQQHNPKDVIVFVPLAMSYDCSLDVSFWTSTTKKISCNGRLNSSLGDWQRGSAWRGLGTLERSQHHPAVLPSPLAASCQDNARTDDHLTPGVHHGSLVKSWPAATNQPTPIQAPRLHCPGSMLMTGVLDTTHAC